MTRIPGIKFKRKQFLKHDYEIIDGNYLIGEIEFLKRDNIFFIKWLSILLRCRNNHYGYKVIEHILSHYKVKCVIGETLSEGRGFWNKCIHKYNGQRKNVHYSSDCTSSFVIPKYEISQDELYKYLYDLYNPSW